MESGPHLGLQQACAFLQSTCPVSVHIIIHMNDDRCTDSVRAESQTCLCRLRAMRLCSCPLRQKSMPLTLLSMTSLVCWSLLRPFTVHLVQSESVNMSTCHCSSDTEDKFSLQTTALHQQSIYLHLPLCAAEHCLAGFRKEQILVNS